MSQNIFPVPMDVVGCADIFERAHYYGIMRHPELFYVRSFCDVNEKLLQEFGARFQVKELYTNVADMLAAHNDGVVLNCTPTRAHAEVAVAALNAKRHCLSEKPISMTLEEADSMLEAARRNDRVLQLCFMSRYAPCWMKIKELLENNAIGKVMSISMTQYWDSGLELYGDWRTDASVSGGGIIADSAAHWVDIFRHLLGEIRSVAATGIPAPDSPRQDVDDSSLALFNFDCGAIGLLRNSWRHKRPDNEAETVEIYGTAGSIIGRLQTPWINGGIQSVKVVKADGNAEYTFNDPMARFANQIAAFADVIEKRCPASAADGRRALEIQQTIYQAMKERRFVELS